MGEGEWSTHPTEHMFFILSLKKSINFVKLLHVITWYNDRTIVKTFKKVKHNYFNKIKDGRGAKSNRSQAHPHPDSHALPYRWNLSTRQSVNKLTNNQPVIHPSNQTLDLSEHDMSHTMHVITELHRAPSRPVTNRSTPRHYSTTLHHTTLPPT